MVSIDVPSSLRYGGGGGVAVAVLDCQVRPAALRGQRPQLDLDDGDLAGDPHGDGEPGHCMLVLALHSLL